MSNGHQQIAAILDQSALIHGILQAQQERALKLENSGSRKSRLLTQLDVDMANFDVKRDYTRYHDASRPIAETYANFVTDDLMEKYPDMYFEYEFIDSLAPKERVCFSKVGEYSKLLGQVTIKEIDDSFYKYETLVQVFHPAFIIAAGDSLLRLETLYQCKQHITGEYPADTNLEL